LADKIFIMNWREKNKQKHQFRSYYCLECKQVKSCGILGKEYCCSCAYQTEREKAEEYSNYQQVYQRKKQEKQTHIQQLQLLRSYRGCKKCGSLAVDAYSLYEESRLVCQPCQIKKEGGSSGSVSFLEQSKWYRKYWGINLIEWLENFSQLPVNANCAREWLKDKEHLKNCKCLEREAKNLVDLFSNSLKECQEKLKDCQCIRSKKVRIGSDYYAWCEICEGSISVASKKRVIKNRNDPKFWGLEVMEKVLCGDCLEKKKKKMFPLRKTEFNRYRKVKRL
jgi:hypothetical protein